MMLEKQENLRQHKATDIKEQFMCAEIHATITFFCQHGQVSSLPSFDVIELQMLARQKNILICFNFDRC